ncbi:MAG TPA: winged helix-turn-helix domain-containing protein, partial [Pyrinomonadaceae bacterium]|nr:winged helix-turn-helix domain-containing protein [Pyrinomonadaceae bacterium]
MEAKSFYDFKNFRLDPEERVLFHDGKPISITPKVFELLKVLIENRGRIIEKEELIAEIWKDSFVEESNLAFNIRQLRKTLGDDAREPTFIETVPKRGYRFIAEVRETSTENGSNNGAAKMISLPVEKSSADSSKFKKFLLPVAAILLIGVIVTGFWYARSKTGEMSAPILSAPFASEKLSTNGKVTLAVISPDGKNVIYTNGMGGDKQSVWLRQIESGSSVEIIPPSDEQYFGLVISPDEKTLYFARGVRLSGEPKDIYRVTIYGGIPQKILSGTELGWMGVSPDGKQISFVRCPQQRSGEFCSLNIANAADGSSERKIVSRPYPFRIGDNRFAPDGKSIAFATGTSVGSSNEFELMEVELESGAERKLSEEKFFDIKNLSWLPDESGLLITASKFPNKNFRIWQVSAATGEASPLTKDSESYSALNMNKDATAIISTQFKENFRIKLIRPENPSSIEILTNANAAAFAPDGKVYFSSIISGNDEIWSINADGSGQRQLTNNTADEFAPIISPDNKSVFFVSNKSGSAQLWRMNTDGSNQTQMTQTDGGAAVFVSPDGEWVYYRHIQTSALWRISLKTGEQQLVLNKAKPRFAFSPDGSRVAFSEKQGDERILTIVSLSDGQTVKTFRMADKKLILMHIVW